MEFEDAHYAEEAELTEELEHGTDAVDTFEIDLFPMDDPLSKFHTKNDPEQPFQRSNVIQRRGAVSIKCDCIDIIHGKFGPGSSDFASLLVLQFRFGARGHGRISEVNIEVCFFDPKGDERHNPEVVNISLNDSYSLVPTKRSESTTKGGDGTVGGGALSATLSGTLSYSKTIDEERQDATHVSGDICRLNAEYGKDNAATWLLKENATAKTGVPATMRVGVLLRRKTQDDFNCTVSLNAKTDFMSSLKDLFGARDEVDPILFRTSIPPTNKLMAYDTENLGKFDVTSVENVTFTTIRSNAIKTI